MINDFPNSQKIKTDSKISIHKEIFKEICKQLRINSNPNESFTKGTLASTLDSLSDSIQLNNKKFNSPSQFSQNFQNTNSTFEKSYRKLLNELNSTEKEIQSTVSNPKTNKLFDLDKLHLNVIKSNMDDKRNNKQKKFSTKLKDIKMQFLTNSIDINNFITTTNGTKNLKKSNFTSLKGAKDTTIDNTESKIKNNVLMSDNMKLIFGRLIKNMNEFTNGNEKNSFGNEFNTIVAYSSSLTTRDPHNKIYEEILGKRIKTIDNNSKVKSTLTKSLVIEKDMKLDRTNSTKNSNRKSFFKKEIRNLLSSNAITHRDTNNFSRLILFKNEFSNKEESRFSQGNQNINHNVKTDKYPDEIISKMQRIVPDLVGQQFFFKKSGLQLKEQIFKKMN